MFSHVEMPPFDLGTSLAGYSPFRSGLALLPITIVMFAFSRLAGRLAMRLGPRLFMATGPIVCAHAMRCAFNSSTTIALPCATSSIVNCTCTLLTKVRDGSARNAREHEIFGPCRPDRPRAA